MIIIVCISVIKTLCGNRALLIAEFLECDGQPTTEVVIFIRRCTRNEIFIYFILK